ncbi:MAG: glycine cleavage system aminomethyltransferase GcvT [Desulfarculaceae bacterium]
MSLQTPLLEWHENHGGKIIDFAGWSLPVQYSEGIINEHLTCRKFGALFDVSHMGRFKVSGPQALVFLNQALTNDASKLRPGRCQYTLISDDAGHPLDDAYLFQFQPDEYLLVVNGANRLKDWEWLSRRAVEGVELSDITFDLAMMAIQGPRSEVVLQAVLNQELPPPGRNHTGIAQWQDTQVLISCTGYTGEPLGFELFIPWAQAPDLWDALARAGKAEGVIAAGLGARDTLRLEACLPLYGHEFRADRPIMAIPQAGFGVSLNGNGRAFVGREALGVQKAEIARGGGEKVSRRIMPVAALGRGMMREGSQVMKNGRPVGELSSGTMVPAWRFQGQEPGDESFNRAIGLAYLDCGMKPGQEVEVEYRGRSLPARIVASFMDIAGVYLRPISL